MRDGLTTMLLLCAAAGANATIGSAAATSSNATTVAAVKWLFNGNNLESWQQVGAGHFHVEEGILKPAGGMGMLWYTREEFGRCSVRVVFRLKGKGADSGVFVRMPRPTADPWYSIDHGYEVEIGDWLDDYGRTGAVYSFSRARGHAAHRDQRWNTLDIHLDGPRITVYVNGVQTTDFRDGQPVPARSREHRDPADGPRPEHGFIGLQNEAGGSVEIREVSVRPLKNPHPAR